MNKIRRIFSEDPMKKMWATFVYFESEPTIKEFLMKKYQNNGFDESFKYAFQNTAKFIYFIKQAREYFNSAEKSSILVKPLLTYYGMMNLLKTVILTKDPHYPSKTGVLRHGITTRKLKKNDFKFHDDEVKIQKEGLLPLFYTLITNNTINKIENNKYRVKELLALLPELSESYNRIFGQQLIFPIDIKENPQNLELIFSKEVLSLFTGDIKVLLNELNNYSKKNDNQFSLIEVNTNQITLLLNSDNILINPMVIQDFKGKYYLRPFKESRLLLPEILVDYMLMYNLGMLCRYETELWGEIIFSFASEDMYIINEFLNSTLRKFPNLILNALFEELLIFDSH